MARRDRIGGRAGALVLVRGGKLAGWLRSRLGGVPGSPARIKAGRIGTGMSGSSGRLPRPGAVPGKPTASFGRLSPCLARKMAETNKKRRIFIDT